MLELTVEHGEHLEAEGFSPAEVVALSEGGWIESIDADQAADRGLKCKSADGSYVSGSGLFFKFSDGFGQLRLDEPIVRPGGATAKYLSPFGRTTETLDPGGALVWTEGAKDAWAGTLRGGIRTGALCGVADWRKLPKDKRITLLYDSDALTNPSVLQQLVKAGVTHRYKVAFVPQVDGQPTAGLCEWFKAGATPDHYRLLVESARKPEQLLWHLPQAWEGLPREQLQPLCIAGAAIAAYAINRNVIDGYLRQLSRLSGLTLSQLRKVYHRKLHRLTGKGEQRGDLKRLSLWEVRPFIREKYEPALNELTQTIEVKGAPLDSSLLDGFKFVLAEDHRVLLSLGDAKTALVTVAAQNSYNPVADYLASIERNVKPLRAEDWERIAQRYLGAADPFDSVKLQRWLIGAVARALDPGCRMQEALILVSSQGKGKSTFFEALGGDWFSDSLGALANIKDDILTLHRAWIHEWSEFDKVTGKREANDLKAFVSRSTDHCRPPYAAQVQELPRRCVLCGTTNREDFLVDPTGSRRYPVIRVQGEIENELVLREREQVWAAAIAAYRRGERWWYDRDETERLMQEGKTYAPPDPWLAQISDALNHRGETTIEYLLTETLGLEISRQSTAEHRRVENCLRRLGWQAETNPDGSAYRRRIPGTGKVRRFWVPAPSRTLTHPPSPSEPLQQQSSKTTCESSEGSEGGFENQREIKNRESGKGREQHIVPGATVRIWCPEPKAEWHRFHGREGMVTASLGEGRYNVMLDQERRSREFYGTHLLLTGSPLDLNGGVGR